MISLLSVERLLGISSFISTPKEPPRAMTRRFKRMGRSRVLSVKPPAPSKEARATEMAME